MTLRPGLHLAPTLPCVSRPGSLSRLVQDCSLNSPARRYFRLHKWIDCWSLAQKSFSNVNADNVAMMLDVSKESLGTIFLLGNVHHRMSCQNTSSSWWILMAKLQTNAMGLTNTLWGQSFAG
jgi:hypothetical protein